MTSEKLKYSAHKVLNGLSPPHLLHSQNPGQLVIPRISRLTAAGRTAAKLALFRRQTLCQFQSRLKTHPLKIKIPFIFWYIRVHCAVGFRTHNFVVSLKIAFIEASQPIRQVVECSTLWSNSVDKHRLCRKRTTLASTSLLAYPRPPILHRYLFISAHQFYIAACLSPPTDSTSLLV